MDSNRLPDCGELVKPLASRMTMVTLPMEESAVDPDRGNGELGAEFGSPNCQSIDWYAPGQSRIVEVAGVRITVRFIGRKGRRGRIAIEAPAGAVFRQENGANCRRDRLEIRYADH